MLSLNDSDRDEFLFLEKNLMLFIDKKFSIYEKFKTSDNFNKITENFSER